MNCSSNLSSDLAHCLNIIPDLPLLGILVHRADPSSLKACKCGRNHTCSLKQDGIAISLEADRCLECSVLSLMLTVPDTRRSM